MGCTGSYTIYIFGGVALVRALIRESLDVGSGMTEEKAKQGNMAKIFGLAFVFEFIMAYCLAMFLNDPTVDLQMGAFYGFLTGFGWIFFALAVNSLYEQKSWKYIFINGGYWTVAFTVMGLILGAWK